MSTFIDPTAFDAFAADYDDDFTHSRLGQLLRPRVWTKLAKHFAPGQYVLELTCGTGEDAVWLAGRGVRVMATDGSAEMVGVAEAKAEAKGCSSQVAVAQVSLQEVVGGYFDSGGGSLARREGTQSVPATLQRSALEREAKPGALEQGSKIRFAGVYSNFGGLNTIGEWQPLAEALAKIVRPGGKVILVPMGPFCPWEIGWYLLHGQPKTAFRRFRSQTTATIGQTTIPIWYPSAKRLRADFAPWFRHLSTESLELWLPPSYLDHFVKRWPNFFTKLNQVEQATAHLTRGWGDHYVIIFERV